MKNKIYRTVIISERFPDKSGDYNTDKGINYFSHSRKQFTEELTQDGGITYTMEVNPKWWLEEIEIPNEEAIQQFANELAQEGVYKWEQEIEAYVDGASFILNHIKK